MSKLSFTKDELQMIRVIVGYVGRTAENEIKSDFGYAKVKKFYDKIGTIEDPDEYIAYTTPEWIKDIIN